MDDSIDATGRPEDRPSAPAAAAAPVELQLRREVMALTLARAVPVAVVMWLVFTVVAWLGARAGAAVPAALLFAAATLSAAWRLAVVRARRAAPEPDDAVLRRFEFLVRANLLFAGLMWTYAATSTRSSGYHSSKATRFAERNGIRIS